MQRFTNLAITRQIQILLAASMLFVFLLAGSIVVAMAVQIRLDSVNRMRQLHADIAAEKLDRSVGKVLQKLETLANLSGYSGAVGIEQRAHFQSQFDHDNTYLSLGTTDRAGQYRAMLSRKSVQVPMGWSGTPALQRAVREGEAYLGPVAVSTAGEQTPEMVMAVPLREPDGSVAGMLVAHISLRFLKPALDAAQPGDGSVLYLQDSDSHVIAASGPAGPSLSGPLALPSPDESRGTYIGLHGLRVMGKATRLPTTGWRLVNELPIRIAYPSIIQRVLLMLGALAAGLALAVFASFHFVRQIALALHDRSQAARTATENALRLSESKLLDTLQSIGAAVIATDHHGNVTRINPSAEALTGWAEAEARGLPLDSVRQVYVVGALAPSTAVPNQALRNNRSIGALERAILTARDGKTYQIDQRISPIVDANGVDIGSVWVFSDRTHTYELQAKLERVSELLARTNRIASIGGWEVDLLSNRLSWTDETFRILDWESDVEPTAEASLELIAPEARTLFQASMRATTHKGEPFDLEFPMVSFKGRKLWARIQATAKKHDGKVVGLLGTVQDITERIRAQTAKQDREDMFMYLASIAPVGIYLTDADGNCTYVNARWCSMAGMSPAQALGTGWAAALHPDDQQRVAGEWAAMVQSDDKVWRAEYRFLAPGGVTTWVFGVAAAQFDEDGAVVRFIGVNSDISLVKAQHAEAQALVRSSAERIRDLAAQADAKSEKERKHIAREIHDELGQTLSALRLELNVMAMRYGDRIADLSSQIQDMKSIIDQAIHSVRSVVSHLRPPALDLGVYSAITWLCSSFSQRSNIGCTLNADTMEQIETTEENATVVFRVVQESLTNVLRHANAENVVVTVRQDDGVLVATIEDDGDGFDERRASNGKTFGLLGMRERAHSVGATLHFKPVMPHGTIVELRIPTLATQTEELAG